MNTSCDDVMTMVGTFLMLSSTIYNTFTTSKGGEREGEEKRETKCVGLVLVLVLVLVLFAGLGLGLVQEKKRYQ